MKKPIIGITMWLRDLPTYLGEQTALYTLGDEYVEKVRAAGGLPILLSHGDAGSDARQILTLIDGLLLSGGGDIHPTSYGEVHDGVSYDVNPRADQWEIDLACQAREQRVPTLGICRGMQIMAIASGGMLAQDLGETEQHPRIKGRAPQQILADRHRITMEAGSQCAAIYRGPVHTVNTIHHQVVTNSGDLAIVARSEDEFIEALEPTDDWQALGVQWHPEKMDDPIENRLFEHLVAMATDYAQSKNKQLIRNDS